MRVADWFEERLQLKKLLGPSMTHHVPRSSASWWYVFGSGTLVIFMLQIVTGICLALVYVPSTADVYASLEYLNYRRRWAGSCAPYTSGARPSWWP
jgi:ubiquinol-cytochrome c reductase cytochrome b subunit